MLLFSKPKISSWKKQEKTSEKWIRSGNNTYAVVLLCLAAQTTSPLWLKIDNFIQIKDTVWPYKFPFFFVTLYGWNSSRTPCVLHLECGVKRPWWRVVGGIWVWLYLPGCGATTPPYNHPFHLCNTHQQTIVAEDLWNQEYQMRALNKRSSFPSLEIGQKTWHGAKGLFRFDFVISWIICIETNQQ